MNVELDPKKTAWASQVVRFRLRFGGHFREYNRLLASPDHQETVNIDTNHAIIFEEDAVARLCHTETVCFQNSLHTLVPDPGSLLQTIEGSSQTADVPFFLEAFWQLHVDIGVDVSVKKCCHRVELVKFPAFQDSAGHNTAGL
jgi:hypothetical protein